MRTDVKRLLLLVKFFDRKVYAERMLGGELYARRLRAFREIEDPARRDALEGTRLWRGGTLSLRSSDGVSVTVPPEEFTGPIEARLRGLDNLNLFCMTAFQSEPGLWPSWSMIEQVNSQIAESLSHLSEIGEHAVVITDAGQFLSRVTEAAERNQWQVCSRSVTYYDSYPADVAFGNASSFGPAFLKRMHYQREREFRIALNTRSMGYEPVTLNVGEIRDIALYLSTQALRNPEWRMEEY